MKNTWLCAVLWLLMSRTDAAPPIPLDTLLYNPALCAGEIVFINGHFYDLSNPAGTEILPGQSWDGTDSVIIVDLQQAPPATFTIQETFCDNQIVLVNGHLYGPSNPSGQELFPGAAANGCDSMVIIDLTFLTAPVTQINQFLCRGDTVFVGSTAYHAGYYIGTEVFENGSWLGCDSTVEVHLTILEQAIDTLSLLMCPGDALVIFGEVYDVNNPEGTTRIPGAAPNGCDSIVTVRLTYRDIQYFISSTPPVCTEINNGRIAIDSVSGVSFPIWWGLHPDSMGVFFNTPQSLDTLASGHYTVYVQDDDGCSMEVPVSVLQPVPLASGILGPDREVFLGDTVCFQANWSEPLDTLSWLPSPPCLAPDCLSGCFQATGDQTFILMLETPDGCHFSDTLMVKALKNPRFYTGNALKPGAEPPNDRFFLQTDGSVARIRYFQIYDRWGGEVFRVENLPSFPYELGWDGAHKGKTVLPGVYVFQYEVELIDGSTVSDGGEVTVVR